VPINETTVQFAGRQGPNPYKGNVPIHVISTKFGDIYCTWEAVFTIEVINPKGHAIFRGDGNFTVVGGTGKFDGATGNFKTLFETKVVKPNANAANADVTQSGYINP
jgi:hypothetical protein